MSSSALPRIIVLSLCLALGASGCRRPRERAYTKEQERVIAEAIVGTRPEVKKALDIEFAEGVRLVAADTDGKPVRRGDAIEVTWVWEALQDIEGGWKIFVHLEGPGRRATHDHHPVDDLFPMGRWKKGQIIRYTQTIPIMADFPEGTARLWAGVFDEAAWNERQENRRMQIVPREGVATETDGDQRVLLAELDISDRADARAPTRRARPDLSPRRYTVHRAPAPPTLDGLLDEPLWQSAPTTGAFVGPDGQALATRRATEARIAWDDSNLYVAFSVLDDRIENTFTGRDATLWKADVVEVYLDPTTRGENYVELQVSPTNEIFDAVFASRRRPEWPEAAGNLTMSGLRSAVHVDGVVNDTGGKQDRRWTVEIAIPFADVPGVGAAPKDGAEWGFNLYRIDQTLMAAWTPVGGDFHNTPAFGRVVFAASAPPGHTPAPPPAPAPSNPAPETPPSGATPPSGETPPGGETP